MASGGGGRNRIKDAQVPVGRQPLPWDYFRLARYSSTMAASMVFRLPTRNFTPLPLALSLETLLRS
jgi:hypothetical protein